MVKTPVVFIFYNRRDLALRVFNEIKKAKPKTLILSSDGPRDEKDREKVLQLRREILDMVDWKCKILKFFYKKNLDFAKHILKTLDRVFQQFDSIIYLEDDTLPNQEFFRFMDKALEVFKNDPRILGINGHNFGYKGLKSDLIMSKVRSIWGCGLYKRLWDLYDFELKDWLKEKKRLKDKFYNKKIFFHYETFFDIIAKGNHFTFDVQMSYVLFKYDKFFILPKYGYIKNLGFNKGSSVFLVHYNMSLSKKPIKNYKTHYFPEEDKKIFDFVLQGGWFRLIGIRIYMNSPRFLQKIIGFLTKHFFSKLTALNK